MQIRFLDRHPGVDTNNARNAYVIDLVGEHDVVGNIVIDYDGVCVTVSITNVYDKSVAQLKVPGYALV